MIGIYICVIIRGKIPPIYGIYVHNYSPGLYNLFAKMKIQMFKVGCPVLIQLIRTGDD